MLTLLIVFLILITLSVILIVFVTTFNQFQDYTIRINEAEESIDATLRKRFDLLNKSIGIIKAHCKEEKILEDIVQIKSKKLTNFELDRRLYNSINEFHTFKEKYPKLQQSDAYLKIELGLAESEAEIVSLRKYYNDIITDYNKMVKSVPSNIIAILIHCKVKPYFDGNNIDKENNDFAL